MVHGVTRQSVFSLLRRSLPIAAAFVLVYPTLASADPAAVAQVVVNVLNRLAFPFATVALILRGFYMWMNGRDLTEGLGAFAVGCIFVFGAPYIIALIAASAAG
jgi:type IV secretory pathway VirB2 component (pilin)